MSHMAIPECACPLASVVVTCKGRLHHLRRTLPNLLIQRCPFPFEVIVVDYGCPQGAFDWCNALNVARLVALKVLDDTGEFHLSRARNCVASVARGRILAFVDADMFPHESWLETAAGPLLQGRVGLCTASSGFQRGGDRGGTCVVSAEVFHAVRGYDEALRGWGCEDDDFYRRAASQTSTRPFPAFLLTPIRHGDLERVRYQSAKEIAQSSARNTAVLARRIGPVNPFGYGQGKFSIVRGQGAVLPPVAWKKLERIVRPLRRQTSVHGNLFRVPQTTC